ncbi:tail fiber assembly protein [Escherichia coli]
MKPVFDVNGLATEPGEIRCYYYDAVTSEYMGWSDEFINIGVSMPGCSTAIEPGAEAGGKVFIFSGSEWVLKEDHRGETAYTTSNGKPVTIEYIGPLREGFTFEAPTTKFDKWDGNKWVTDTEAQHSAAVDAAEAQRQSLIDAAMASISLIQLKLQAGRKLTQAETTRLNAVLDYIDAVTATDTSTAPDVIWPELPETAQ